jgi:dihydroflavonol-4-reductase
MDGKTEEEICRPAIEGTRAILEGCKENGVKKCVFTASMVTVMGPDNIKTHYNDTDFAPADGDNATPYAKSKILAEKCIWDFHKNLPENSPLEIVTIHPGFIFG